jgi:uncharacterized protein (DUF58 family)
MKWHSSAQMLEPAIRWLTRREHPAGREVTLHRRRIYILPTRAGYVYGMMLVIMLLGAVNYTNSMAFLLTFLLVGLGANGIWHTHRNLLGLRVIRLPAKPVFAGESAHCLYRIENPGHVPRRALMLHRGPSGGEPVAVEARSGTIARLSLPAERRGHLRPGRFSISTVYPLGLFRAWSWIEFDEAVTVYPRPVPANATPPRPSGDKDTGVTRPLEGDEFAGLREYQRGDSPRQVDWKALARTGDLYTRNFEVQRGGNIWLDWDALPATDTETRLSMLCYQVLKAHERGLCYGLRLPGIAFEPDRGAEHRSRCLTALAHFGHPA